MLLVLGAFYTFVMLPIYAGRIFVEVIGVRLGLMREHAMGRPTWWFQ